MRNLYLYGLFILIITACTPQEKTSSELEQTPKNQLQAREELYQEVIEIHDIAMLKMEKTMMLSRAATKKTDSLNAQKDDVNLALIHQLEESVVALESANKLMMVWMRGFRPPADTVADTLAIPYLKAEQRKIAAVNTQMNQAIATAKHALEE